MLDDEEIELSQRELAIARKAAELAAKRAAELAVEKMQNEFYQHVGKSVIRRGLVVIGLIAVGIAAGKGWISVSALK